MLGADSEISSKVLEKIDTFTENEGRQYCSKLVSAKFLFLKSGDGVAPTTPLFM